MKKREKLPRLPAAAGASDDAAVLDVGDAAQEPGAPMALPPTHMRVASRPKRKQYDSGKPLAAAIVREVEEMRKKRDEDAAQSASLYNRALVSPRQARVASLPKPAATSASLQAAASKMAGLEGMPRPPISLAPAPPGRLGYAHDGPQPQRPPQVAAFAIEAEAAAVEGELGHDMWSNRTTRAGTLEGVVKGAHSLVIGEVESLLAECGVTSDMLAQAGLSVEESRRLLYALYVHSSGFLQMLADAFANLPHRAELLACVWTGFATLIERAKVNGADEVGYTSQLAQAQRESKRIQAELRNELARVSAYLQGQLDDARGEATETETLRKDQEERAVAAETLAATTARERDELRAELERTAAELKQESATRERVEKALEAETRNLVPLRAQASQLPAARTEAQNANALVVKLRGELAEQALILKARDAALTLEETHVKVLRAELPVSDTAVVVMGQAYAALGGKRDALKQELAEEHALLQASLEGAKRKEQASKEQLKQLMAQMEETDANAVKEKRARAQAEATAKELEGNLKDKEEELAERDEKIKADAAILENVRFDLKQREQDVIDRDINIETMGRSVEQAQRGQELATTELKDSQAKAKQLIGELNRTRDESKNARKELDDVKMQAFRDCDQMRSEMKEVVAEKEMRVTESDEAREAVEMLQDRVQKLEADVRRQRVEQAERENAHQQSLLDLEKSEKMARATDANSIQRATDKQNADAKVLTVAMAEVGALAAVVEQMRDDVDRLTQDNRAYAAEVAAYEEALTTVYELHSTLDMTKALEVVIDDLGGEVIEQLSLQSEQQRCIDATERDMMESRAHMEDMSTLCAEMLQPLVDEAQSANAELPLLREELMNTAMLRNEVLRKLSAAQDAAEDEKQQHIREMTGISKILADAKEQAKFTTELQAEQLDKYRKELEEANEELTNWRSGNIRLSNAKQWREERSSKDTGSPLPSKLPPRGGPKGSPGSGGGIPGRAAGWGGGGGDAGSDGGLPMRAKRNGTGVEAVLEEED